MKINEKIKAILLLPGLKRYSHFIKVAVDQRKVLGLFLDGWALVGVEAEKEASPLWPADQYATLCAFSEWAGYSPREIDLDTLLTVLIPKLKESGTSVTIFPTPSQKGVLPVLATLEDDLRNELSRLE